MRDGTIERCLRSESTRFLPRASRQGLPRKFLVVQADRQAIITPSHVAGAPDLMVEVLLPATRARDLRIKAPLYCRASVLEYWALDPIAQVVIRHQLTDTQYVVTRYGLGETLTTALDPDQPIAVADCFSS